MRTTSRLSVSKEWVGHKGCIGKNMAWTHPGFPGVIVKHCGHATALQPYYIPGGYHIAFRSLRRAQWWVEHGGHLLEDEAKAEELYQEMTANDRW